MRLRARPRWPAPRRGHAPARRPRPPARWPRGAVARPAGSGRRVRPPHRPNARPPPGRRRSRAAPRPRTRGRGAGGPRPGQSGPAAAALRGGEPALAPSSTSRAACSWPPSRLPLAGRRAVVRLPPGRLARAGPGPRGRRRTPATSALKIQPVLPGGVAGGARGVPPAAGSRAPAGVPLGGSLRLWAAARRWPDRPAPGRGGRRPPAPACGQSTRRGGRAASARSLRAAASAVVSQRGDHLAHRRESPTPLQPGGGDRTSSRVAAAARRRRLRRLSDLGQPPVGCPLAALSAGPRRGPVGGGGEGGEPAVERGGAAPAAPNRRRQSSYAPSAASGQPRRPAPAPRCRSARAWARSRSRAGVAQPSPARRPAGQRVLPLPAGPRPESGDRDRRSSPHYAAQPAADAACAPRVSCPVACSAPSTAPQPPAGGRAAIPWTAWNRSA